MDLNWTNLGSSSPTIRTSGALAGNHRLKNYEVPPCFLSSQRYSIKKTYWVSQKGIVIRQLVERLTDTFLQCWPLFVLAFVLAF